MVRQCFNFLIIMITTERVYEVLVNELHVSYIKFALEQVGSAIKFKAGWTEETIRIKTDSTRSSSNKCKVDRNLVPRLFTLYFKLL